MQCDNKLIGNKRNEHVLDVTPKYHSTSIKLKGDDLLATISHVVRFNNQIDIPSMLPYFNCIWSYFKFDNDDLATLIILFDYSWYCFYMYDGTSLVFLAIQGILFYSMLTHVLLLKINPINLE